MTKNRFSVLVIGAFSLLPAASAAAQPAWGRGRPAQAGACFYEDIDFRGRAFCVAPGDALRRIPDGLGDRISSFRLLGASEVTVFRDSDMRGRAASFTRDESDLRRSGWNDQISSLEVSGAGFRGRDWDGDRDRDRRERDREWDRRERDRDWDRDGNRDRYETGPYGWRNDGASIWGRDTQPREGACFYEDTNYRGQFFCVPRGGTYASLPRGFSDRISSVRVFGAEVRLYEDRDFRGHSREIHRDAKNLGGGWRDAISSIRVY